MQSFDHRGVAAKLLVLQAKRLAPLSVVTVLPLLLGCVSFYSLTPKLDQAVGKNPQGLGFPFQGPRRILSEDEASSSVLFSLDGLWHCTWQVEISRLSGTITKWRYPDAVAERWCSELASTRP